MELIDLEELPQRLLRAWRDRNIEEFKKALAEGCDVNYIYKEENFQPILGAIARDINGDGKPFAEAVLATPNVDKDKQYASGKCAIHHAAEIGNLPVLEAIVESGANLNVQDQNGSTALHVIAQQKWKGDTLYRKCMELLLSKKQVQANVVNRQGVSAIHMAVSKNNREAVIALLEKGSLLDIDNTSVMGKSTRDAILQKYPDLEAELPKNMGPEWSFVKMDGSNLFTILMQGEQNRFCDAFEKEMQDKAQRNLLTYDNGKYTLLQYSVRERMNTVVEALLSRGADPNYTPHHNNETPVEIAVTNGYPDTLKMLLDVSVGPPGESGSGATPLHTVTKYCLDSPPHLECLKLLLGKTWDHETKLDVNAKDCLGNTCLHYAVMYSDEETIRLILDHGAYIGAVNRNGEMPLPKIPPGVLRGFLDTRIKYKGAMQNSKEELTIDFSFLAPPHVGEPCPQELALLFEEKGLKQRPKSAPETKPLLAMSQTPDLRKILTHPVLTSFTYLKWQRIQTFFFVNLLFYLALCILLTGYILLGYRTDIPVDSHLENSIIDDVPHKIGHDDKINYSKPEIPDRTHDTGGFATIVIRVIILIFLVLLFVRESFQFTISPRSYLKNVENYIELLLIFISMYVIVHDCSQSFNSSSKLALLCPQFSAIAILICWVELVLLIGKHPNFSIQVEMFRTVSLSFIKFLTWYILIIIAFALSFFVLFRGCTGECTDKNPFTSPGTSLFKTLVMLTGEFEAGDIPFVTFIGTSHIIFTAFVFLIAIVLLNLLNGLAVADTKEIRDDVYLYSCVARVKLICFVEDMLWGDTTYFLRPIYSLFNSHTSYKFVLLEYFGKQIVFFPDLLPTGQIKVHLETGNSVEFVGAPAVSRNCISGYNLDWATVREARQLEEYKRANKPKKDELGPKVNACCEKVEALTNQIAEFEKRYTALEEANKRIEQLLIQQMAIVSLNHANEE